MTIEERLYECGVMYARIRADKQAAALRALDSIEGALADLNRRVDRWMQAAERDAVQDGEG